MKSAGILVRRGLHARRSRFSTSFIGGEGTAKIMRRPDDFSYEYGCIFNGKGCTLCKEGQDRMGCITKKRHIALAPMRTGGRVIK